MSAIMLPPIIQAKPTYGAPCNGCGLCCAREVCKIGKQAHGDIEGPCPSLLFKDGRFWCAFVLAERIANLEPIIERTLAIGFGCDSDTWEEFA